MVLIEDKMLQPVQNTELALFVYESHAERASSELFPHQCAKNREP
jgi:hypothetical protein